MKKEFHEVAKIFPMMEGQEFEDLKADIAANGLIEPIWLHEDRIIDGRNRYLACVETGIEPRFRGWNGNGSLVSFVVSLNLKRRHLNSSQKAVAAESALPMYEAEARERMLSGVKGNPSQKVDQGSDTGKAAEKAAKDFGTNRQYIADIKVIKEKAPEKIAEIQSGAKTIARVRQEIKREEVKTKLQEVAAKEVEQPTGKFDVIVIDPPWNMKKIDRDCRPNQVGFDYPTMSDEQLLSLEIPSAENCHLWLWTTHKHLPFSFSLLEEWGFKYVCAFVWHKPGGFQPIGLPQYNCEFAIYARKGTPSFLDTKSFNVCFNANRGRHSEKPNEFYETIRRVTCGRRLDMFSRRKIDGFVGWGKEA